MQALNTMIVVVAIFALHAEGTLACEKFTKYKTDELKEYRDMLNKGDADPFDRLFAFEKLVCADNPNLRSYAIKQGLDSSADPLVRNQVMLKALMQKKRIDVELHTNDDLKKRDKEFISKHSAIYSKVVPYRSEKDGCVSLQYKECTPTSSMFIIGDKVEYNYDTVLGEFRLSQTGELVGFLRARNSNDYSRIPAVIRLY